MTAESLKAAFAVHEGCQTGESGCLLAVSNPFGFVTYETEAEAAAALAAMNGKTLQTQPIA